MSKKITLLGSTGSIGTQSLDVIRAQGYEVFGLSAHSHVDKILEQIEEFHPKYVCMTNPDAAAKLDAALAGRANAPKLLTGPEGLKELAAMDGPDVVLNSVVGIAGLGASLTAIESGHDLALANKESLVTGGAAVARAHMNEVKRRLKEEKNAKDEDVLVSLQLVNEMLVRGYEFLPIELGKSRGSSYIVEDGKVRLPFSSLKGLGGAAADALEKATLNGQEYLSIEELQQASGVSNAILDRLRQVGALGDLPESSQVSFF